VSPQDSVDRKGVVAAVNQDGTVNVLVGGAYIPNLQALDSYLVRAVEDIVLIRQRDAQMIVLGRTGPEITIPTTMDMTVSDSSAPAGAGWQEIVSGQVWAKPGPPGSLWMKNYVPYVPPPPTSVDPAILSKGAIEADTYRGGSRQFRSYGEQGDYSGLGLQTGVWTFGTGAWAALSGKTIDAFKVQVTRRSEGHGFTWGPVDIVFRMHNDANMQLSTPTMLGTPYRPGSLGLGSSAPGDGFILPNEWAGWLRDGTAAGIAIYSDDARLNLEAYAGLTLNVAYH
jgi:hypothetical protein